LDFVAPLFTVLEADNEIFSALDRPADYDPVPICSNPWPSPFANLVGFKLNFASKTKTGEDNIVSALMPGKINVVARMPSRCVIGRFY
jgi:hypothetical protein